MTITTEPAYVFHRGSSPLLISMPHSGTYVPPQILARLTEEARQLPDTDWHLPQLYAFARQLDASILIATHSRYVIDLNRPPDGASLYPGQSVTGLCPIDSFDDTPLYARAEDQPDEAEIAARRTAIWQPYHARLREELDRIKARHGIAILWDAHSIRSVLPRFFRGKLPDLNIGTADGASCAPALAEQLLAIARQAPGHDSVLNGRFKGGHITRHYGHPDQGFHAVQLEMTQACYMQESLPFDYLPERAAQIQPTLEKMLHAVLGFARRAPAGA
ncbi:N-formylglutamate amidohydrolase [Lampropedia cohaerens]|uniref:N-formylglutamate amidohydrolase n=1 Tax=Lampropedia cohaerens TaxID=1610491 RepID=A0A0U1Q1F8_9BURK|nr:N-formylglutamate deformylase [Lampropedia cohaerens]KKW68593.1 N-formylglutamate amidohydrolase [Lampropedia cohaerens]